MPSSLPRRSPSSRRLAPVAAAIVAGLALSLIRRTIAQAGGNIAEAARLLGLHRTLIYRVLAEALPPPPRFCRWRARAPRSALGVSFSFETWAAASEIPRAIR